MKRIFSIIVIMLLVCSAYAGSGYTVKCLNQSCNYSGEVNFGGGKMFEQLTGYCPACQQFVYLSWKRNTRAPAPVGEIWLSRNGTYVPLYLCPHCQASFAEVYEPLNFCPKCEQKTLKSELTIMYD